ncbi:hypothetical protein LTR17_011750 [Elasticomyces elasticus]|nr:hypothetical protein LTR17_011750 [Elasticomyces elasticus]
MTSTVSVSAVADAAHALQELAITTPDHTGEVTGTQPQRFAEADMADIVTVFTDTAAHKVFRIPELLIMLRLEPTQLFVNIRVNRMWHKYFSRSTALKVEMFLLSGPATTDLTKVKVNPFMDPKDQYTDYPQRSSFKLSPTWTQAETSISKTLIVRTAMKDARLSIFLRFKNLKRPLAHRVRLHTLKDVANAIESAVDDAQQQVLDFSVFSTRVYADEVWRGHDIITGKVVRPESANERRYRLEWERYEREGPEAKAEDGLRMRVLGEMVQVW